MLTINQTEDKVNNEFQDLCLDYNQVVTNEKQHNNHLKISITDLVLAEKKRMQSIITENEQIVKDCNKDI